MEMQKANTHTITHSRSLRRFRSSVLPRFELEQLKTIICSTPLQPPSRLHHFWGCCWVFGLFSLKCNKQKWFLCETFSDNVWKRFKTYLMFYVRTQAVRWKYKYVRAKIIAGAQSCHCDGRRERHRMRERKGGEGQSEGCQMGAISGARGGCVGLAEDIRSPKQWIHCAVNVSRCTQMKTCTIFIIYYRMCKRARTPKQTNIRCAPSEQCLKLRRNKEERKQQNKKNNTSTCNFQFSQKREYIPTLGEREEEGDACVSFSSTISVHLSSDSSR